MNMVDGHTQVQPKRTPSWAITTGQMKLKLPARRVRRSFCVNNSGTGRAAAAAAAAVVAAANPGVVTVVIAVLLFTWACSRRVLVRVRPDAVDLETFDAAMADARMVRINCGRLDSFDRARCLPLLAAARCASSTLIYAAVTGVGERRQVESVAVALGALRDDVDVAVGGGTEGDPVGAALDAAAVIAVLCDDT